MIINKLKKIAALAAMLMALILIYGAPVSAQIPKRIQFAKGKTSAVVKGETGSVGLSYVVKAAAGQKLVLTLTPTIKIGIKVTTDGADGEAVLLREEQGGTYEIGLETSGDYTILIGSADHQSVTFTLIVKITKLADI